MNLVRSASAAFSAACSDALGWTPLKSVPFGEAAVLGGVGMFASAGGGSIEGAAGVDEIDVAATCCAVAGGVAGVTTGAEVTCAISVVVSDVVVA